MWADGGSAVQFHGSRYISNIHSATLQYGDIRYDLSLLGRASASGSAGCLPDSCVQQAAGDGAAVDRTEPIGTERHPQHRSTEQLASYPWGETPIPGAAGGQRHGDWLIITG